jgi:hypothetical protein
MSKTIKQKQKRWDEFYEDKLLTTQVRKNSSKETDSDRQRYLLESRFQLMEDSLNKTKLGSNEFNDLLEECVDIFLELNQDKNLDRNTVIKMTKERILKDEIVGELDGKKLKEKKGNDWPLNGRITLRDAIIAPSETGRHPSKGEEKRVKSVFAPFQELDKDSPSKKK